MMAANRTSQLHEASIQATWLLQRLGRELRLARIAAGLSQATIAARLGTSKARISRIELGKLVHVSIPAIARHAAAVGLRLSMQMYPGARRVLDAPQLALLGRLRDRLGELWSWQLEVPMPLHRDLRAVDALITRGAISIAVEAITRLADVQAQGRAAQLKRRDIGATHLLLLIADTNANRKALAEAEPMLAEAFELSTRRVLNSLSSGADPGRDCLIVL